MNKPRLIVNNSKNELKEEIFFFNKNELKTILNLYAKMVSDGSWKDYGFNISKKNVSFNIFKRSSENAIFNIYKNFKTKNDNLRYYVSDDQGNILSMSKNLETLIDKVKWNKYKIVN